MSTSEEKFSASAESYIDYTSAASRQAFFLLAVSMALYCVIGFTGFDPSRQDEAYIFGIILEYLHGNNWVVPQLAGQPFMEKPPLYYLLGAISAKLFSPLLPLHDAARLSSAFLTAITTICIAGSARLTWGAGYGRFAALALLSSIGLMIPAHMMLTDNAKLAGLAIAILGLSTASQGKWWAGIVIGTGVGISFMAKGLYGPAIIGMTALMLLAWPSWRSRDYAKILIVACVAAMPWLLFWPIKLYRVSPELFNEWFVKNNFARYLGFAPARLNAVNDKSFWYTSFLWGTFPVLPLAVCSIRSHWQKNSQLPGLQIGLAFSLSVVAILATSHTVRAIYALPLVLGLSLIAAPLLLQPLRWMKSTALLGQALFVLLATVSWGYWFILVSGSKLPLLQNTFLRSSSFHYSSPLLTGLTALSITGLWLSSQYSWRSEPWRNIAQWYISLFCGGALFALLALPSLAAESSYRGVFLALREQLPANGCIGSVGLGESQRGMLDYVAGIKTQASFDLQNSPCAAVIVDESKKHRLPEVPHNWHLAWSGSRSADDHEIFFLFMRDTDRLFSK